MYGQNKYANFIFEVFLDLCYLVQTLSLIKILFFPATDHRNKTFIGNTKMNRLWMLGIVCFTLTVFKGDCLTHKKELTKPDISSLKKGKFFLSFSTFRKKS